MAAKNIPNEPPEPFGPGERQSPEDSAETADFPPTPKSLTFRYLAILWCLPSFGAIWILIAEVGRVLSPPSFLKKLGAVSMEQWVSVVLLLLHLIFVGLAMHFRRKENRASGSRS